jgi:hypothetical protein
MLIIKIYIDDVNYKNFKCMMLFIKFCMYNINDKIFNIDDVSYKNFM